MPIKRRMMPHQITAFSYARRIQHPALFLEMRLGKTLVTIRRIQMYDKPLSQHLIVAPMSVLGVWESELRMEGETDIVQLIGLKKQRQSSLTEGHKWNLINKEGYIALPEIAEVKWDTVVIDESVCIKNPNAKITKFYLDNFRNVPHRFILTGKPNPESDLELWCQFAFLDGQAFGYDNYWKFRAGCYTQSSYGYEWVPMVGTPTKIHKYVSQRACVIRRQDVHLENIRVYEERKLQLPPDLRESYDIAEEEFICIYANEILKTTLNALTTYVWLQYFANGNVQSSDPYAEVTNVWRGKLDELVYLLSDSLAGESVLVWCHSRCDIDLIQKELTHLGYSVAAVHGDIPPFERTAIFNDFQKGVIKILVLQVSIAQYGIDLSKADTAIFYNGIISLTCRKQAEDRIVHPDKRVPLLFIDLVTEDTVDEDIVQAIKDKSIASNITLSRAVFLKAQARRNR